MTVMESQPFPFSPVGLSDFLESSRTWWAQGVGRIVQPVCTGGELNDSSAALQIQPIVPQGPTGGILQIPNSNSGFAQGLATKHQVWLPELPPQPESSPAFGPALANALIPTSSEFWSSFQELWPTWGVLTGLQGHPQQAGKELQCLGCWMLVGFYF